MALTFISAGDYAEQISKETVHNGSYWRISNLWHKGDFSLLYADDRKEATSAAFAMATNVSPGLAKTLFVSFPQNLRDIQPQLRGSDNVQVFIPTTNLENDFAETLIENLRTAINDHGFDTIVIDNLNRISALSTGRNAALTQLVTSLFALHVETDATILISAY
ncbi:MAG: AAA family ATPase, partial [Muribaculaceae bacterium]|nr:AAA family ATPase [Muribaculaceae bacterium]